MIHLLELQMTQRNMETEEMREWAKMLSMFPWQTRREIRQQLREGLYRNLDMEGLERRARMIIKEAELQMLRDIDGRIRQ